MQQSLAALLAPKRRVESCVASILAWLALGIGLAMVSRYGNPWNIAEGLAVTKGQLREECWWGNLPVWRSTEELAVFSAFMLLLAPVLLLWGAWMRQQSSRQDGRFGAGFVVQILLFSSLLFYLEFKLLFYEWLAWKIECCTGIPPRYYYWPFLIRWEFYLRALLIPVLLPWLASWLLYRFRQIRAGWRDGHLRESLRGRWRPIEMRFQKPWFASAVGLIVVAPVLIFVGGPLWHAGWRPPGLRTPAVSSLEDLCQRTDFDYAYFGESLVAGPSEDLAALHYFHPAIRRWARTQALRAAPSEESLAMLAGICAGRTSWFFRDEGADLSDELSAMTINAKMPMDFRLAAFRANPDAKAALAVYRQEPNGPLASEVAFYMVPDASLEELWACMQGPDGPEVILGLYRLPAADVSNHHAHPKAEEITRRLEDLLRRTPSADELKRVWLCLCRVPPFFTDAAALMEERASDRDPAIRRAAIEALTETRLAGLPGRVSLRQALVSCALNDTDSGVRDAAELAYKGLTQWGEICEAEELDP